MSDYSQGKIYKIISSECDLVYYGSTVDPLNVRLIKHKSSYKCYLEGKKNYITSFEIIHKGNYEIVLVENYPCNSKEELRLREGEYIKNNECVNKFIPGRTTKEYHEANKEKIREYNKKYRVEHNDELREYNKKYRVEHNDELREYNKKYRVEHNDELREQHKQYREANKEKIREHKNKKVICEICGIETLKSNISRHQKSKKCLEHNNIINI
jgi:hypothetical protein